MSASATLSLAGVFPPLTTPFAADDSLALDRLKENIARYNRTRLAGYVVTGSTGEAILLTWDETQRLWDAAREAAAPGKILIAGTGAESAAETLERTNRAAAFGYAAALVRTPHYYKPQMTPETLAEFYLRVADAARIPILIYSVPQFTGVTVEAPLVARLAAHPNIAGIKESSGSAQRVAEMVAAAPAPFQVLAGGAASFYPCLAVGAVGAVLALACALPEACVELYEAVRDGQAERARGLQLRLLRSATTLGSRYGIPGLKYALDRLGYSGGPSRRPLLPVDDAGRREIDAALAAASPGVVAAR